ncbi:MAG: hypothetical protein IPM24_16900 [Bryobacterales bacterium]|nr:hypothetical protein [Bryobacterales bacterium]
MNLEAQEQSPEKQPTPACENEEVSGLLRHALALPAEFASDIILTIAEKDLCSRSEIAQWVIDSFTLASHARRRLPQARMSGRSTDSRNGLIYAASSLGLDSLTLKVRAIRVLLKHDRHAAMRLFFDLHSTFAHPTLAPRVACTSEIVPDPDLYYILAREVVGAVSADDSALQTLGYSHAHEFLRFVIATANSPLAIGSAIELVNQISSLESDSLAIVSGALADSLRRIDAGDRAFMMALSRTARIERTSVLLQQAERSPQPLLEAYRIYLLRHLTGKRCSDGAQASNRIVDRFNASLKRLGMHESVSPIANGKDVLATSGALPRAEDDPFWVSGQSRQILRAVQRLRYGRGGKPHSKEEIESLQWRQRFDELNALISTWKIDDEKDDLSYIFQKGTIYLALLEMTAENTDYTQPSTLLASFLASSYSDGHRIEWYYIVDQAFKRVMSLPPAVQRTFLDSAIRSGNSIMEVRARMAQLLGVDQDG